MGVRARHCVNFVERDHDEQDRVPRTRHGLALGAILPQEVARHLACGHLGLWTAKMQCCPELRVLLLAGGLWTRPRSFMPVVPVGTTACTRGRLGFVLLWELGASCLSLPAFVKKNLLELDPLLVAPGFVAIFQALEGGPAAWEPIARARAA